MDKNISQDTAVAVDPGQHRKAKTKRKLRRLLSGALALTIGLTGVSLIASALTPDPQRASADTDQAALVSQGKDIYDTACITCHGQNLQGVDGRGPSLIGTGEGATYFQITTGRMPMMRNEAQASRKPSRYSEDQALALAAYVQANGGGPGIVRDADGAISSDSLRGSHNLNGEIQPMDVARGSDLFRLNCASCHNFTGQGGALSSGKYAPTLKHSSEQDIYQAMLTGPQNMPKFSDRQLTADEKKDIIAYIKYTDESKSPSGVFELGNIGPVTEGALMWGLGIVVLVGAAVWIGTRS